MEFRVVVPMKPISANRMYRNFRGRTIISKEGRDYKEAFLAYLIKKRIESQIFVSQFNSDTHVIEVELNVYLKEFFTKAGKVNLRAIDLDNCQKINLDIVFRFLNIDDARVVKITSQKMLSDSDAFEITLNPVPIKNGPFHPEIKQ